MEILKYMIIKFNHKKEDDEIEVIELEDIKIGVNKEEEKAILEMDTTDPLMTHGLFVVTNA
jgi:hypothetical protein